MKKILGIIFLSLLLSENAFAGKIRWTVNSGPFTENGPTVKEVYQISGNASSKKSLKDAINKSLKRCSRWWDDCIVFDIQQWKGLIPKKISHEYVWEEEYIKYKKKYGMAQKNTLTSNNQSGSNSSSSTISTDDKIAQSKQICKDLGFKTNTEKFADCALKMMSIQFETTNKVASSSGGTTQEIIVKHKNDYDVWDALLDVSNVLLSDGNNSSSSSSNNNTRCVIGRTNPTFGTTTMNCR